VISRVRLIQVFRCGLAFGLAVIVIAGLAGQLIRDRSAATAILMYLPLLPASLVAIVLDIARRGRAIPRARFLLTFLGIFGGTCSVVPMIGSDRVGEYGATDIEVTLLHWNVLWGGGPFRSERTWASLREEIVARDPDLILLSELPRPEWLKQLVDQVGPGANVVGIERSPRSPYGLQLGVCSRWPIQLEKRMTLPGGVAMSVAAAVRGREMRLLVVDGKSNPFQSRLPFLAAIAQACREAVEAGRPFDAVVGDFNTPSRSIGFDSLTALGYTLASRSAAGWRGTFPSWLPIYDIDHVWIRLGLRIRSCTLFTAPASDHRGQFVSLLLPEPDQEADQGEY
jgi:Endonuclease/Exonuclease/phosphatase family